MRKAMLHVLSGALVVGTMLWIGTQSARAIKPFKEEFELKYVKADKEDAEKIRKALDTVAKMKSDPKDEKSPTFGELLQAGQLPGGDPGEQGGEEDDEQ